MVANGASEDLWENLFLSPAQIKEFLEFVKATAASPFVYPMMVFIGHTGARRAEMLRSQVTDFDFDNKRVRVREKKRDTKLKETTRYVDMSPLLEEVMKEWLKNHPGGQFSFCSGGAWPRSKKQTATAKFAPLTEKECYHHFKRTLSESKWRVVKGFHTFRHSFASNLAMAGARQEVIDKLLGHQTEDMRRRYRHLFPHETIDAMKKVFG